MNTVTKEEKLVDGQYKLECDRCFNWSSRLMYNNGLHLCNKCFRLQSVSRIPKEHMSSIVKAVIKEGAEIEENIEEKVAAKLEELDAHLDNWRAALQKEIEDYIEEMKDKYKCANC